MQDWFKSERNGQGIGLEISNFRQSRLETAKPWESGIGSFQLPKIAVRNHKTQ